jgi:hypothetical protein
MNYSKKTASLVMPLIKLRKHGSRIKLPKECNRILEQKQLKAFILNPSSFRHGVKCPNQQTSTQRYRRNRLLFRIHGKSQAITRFEYSIL